MTSSRIYVIHSNKSIKDISYSLENCGPVQYIGIIYKTHRTNGKTEKKETQMTIIICPNETMDKFKENHPELLEHISDYNWSTFPMPKEEDGETWDLHVSGIPDDFTELDAKSFIKDSLACILNEVDVIDGANLRNYELEFPLRSRGTGFIRGFGKINFGSHVDKTIIKMCKVILHNTPLSRKTGQEHIMVSCVWHRLSNKLTSLEKPKQIKTNKMVTWKTRGMNIDHKKKWRQGETYSTVSRAVSDPSMIPQLQNEKETQVVSVTDLTEGTNVDKTTN